MAEPVPTIPVSAVSVEPVSSTEQYRFSRGHAPAEQVAEVYQHTRSAFRHSYQKAERLFSGILIRGKRNARYLYDEKPLQLVAGIAAASFLVGAALRVWRSHHA